MQAQQVQSEFAWREWLSRAEKYFTPAELAIFTLPGFLAALAKYALAPDRELLAEDLSRRDPEYVKLLMDLTRVVGERYFRWKYSGVEHVPPTGRALLVGSHNGGLITFDSMLTMLAVFDHHGKDRAVYPLSHDVLHSNAMLRKHAAQMGVLRAGHTGAEKALRNEHLVLVYPGSDLDATRPFRDRYKIELGGRKGFLKLALRNNVPIIPVVSVGTHEQWVVLTRGDKIAERLMLKKLLRIEVFPIVFSLPWGITSGFVPYIPLPAQTSVRFGPPIHWPELDKSCAEDPQILQRCYDQVRAALQVEMDALSIGRRPFIG
jgi:1-acyl-sn-glycerol-3-phosphate acyltransferase